MPFSLRAPALGACLSLLLVVSASAQQSAKPQNAAPYPRVAIPGSEMRSLKSANTGRAYDLYIHLPAASAQDKEKKFPVLYLLDGQWDFKLLDSVYGGLLYDKFVPEMIIVGITYSGDNPNYDALRAMDYTPAAESRNPGSGDAPKFLAFLKRELVPFIETNYKADASRRILMGSSLGGLFTLYAMFTEPGLFSGYVSASPAVPYGDRFAFKQESEYASKHQDLPARLFLSVGDIEDLTAPVKEFMQVLSTRRYKGLKLETRLIEGERHAGNKPEAFNRGLRFVFQGE
jgi:predicted alpha/beta superfamily hydrolase